MALIDRVGRTDALDTAAANSRKVDSKNSADQAAFHMPDEDYEGVIYEPEEKEEKQKTWAQVKDEIAAEEREAARQNLHSRFDGPGVEVELSTEAVKKVEEDALPKQGFVEFLKGIVESIKLFFDKLWNGEDGAQTAKSAEDANDKYEDRYEDKYADRYEDRYYDESGDKYAAVDTSRTEETSSLSNDAESIANFMVDYGGRRLAKNSDLLTQYDRTGKIVTPNASDKRRILQGDGKTRKY